MWLSEGKGDHCGNVAGGPLSNTAQLNQLVPHPLNFLGFLLCPNNAGTGVYSTCCYGHIYPETCLLDVVKQTAVKEGLNGANGPNIVLVFPSLDEGNESGGVQM